MPGEGPAREGPRGVCVYVCVGKGKSKNISKTEQELGTLVWNPRLSDKCPVGQEAGTLT